MIGKYPIFAYCAICAKTVFYPLSRLLFGSNLCWQHGLALSWPHWESRISFWVKHLPCYSGLHRWVCDGGYVATSGLKDGNTHVCRVCFKRKYTWVSLKVARKRREVADEIARNSGRENGKILQSEVNEPFQVSPELGGSTQTVYTGSTCPN